uniref:Uncharacterized protein LOC117347285 n=1 Tax=Geotrypetes seraphini TaxID=260995 RepID=A0A6P8NYM2_GEOSA|nr:uncharacterized protein LOC117347285 [Geotrypetes seraphini]XP_033773895.1 uncharacterized protein LOC117347285 [Geotrypetes seraphini]
MKKIESLKNMMFRLQNIVQILCIFYFILFSVQATLPTLPNEVTSSDILSLDAENATSAPNKPEAASILATGTVNTTVLEHNASTNWSKAATIPTSTNARRLSTLTTLSHFTRNSTDSKHITSLDATARFSTEETTEPPATPDHTLNVSATQGIHANVTVSTVATLTSTNEHPPAQSDISLVTDQITKTFAVIHTSRISGNEIRLKNSEAILTIAFSIILGIVVVVLLIYSLNKYKKRRLQYSHHPLHDTSYESADRYSVPDDTLVISGGLYDAPRVYNPNMTVLEDEDSQYDYVSFGSRPGQFRLEFLPGEKEREPTYESSAFEIFHSLQKNS